MKRLHTLPAIALALLLPLHAQAVLVTLDVSAASITVGESFTVDVLVDGEGIGEDLLAFGFDVAPPGAVASYLGASVGPLFADASDPFNPDNVSGIAFPGIADDDVLLATLSFSATAAGTDTLSVSGAFDGLFYGLFYEFTGADIAASTRITVADATTTVAEPGAALMLGAGFAALLGVGMRRRRTSAA